MDSYGLRPLVNNNNASQASLSNTSFNTSMDQNYGQSNHMSSSSSSLLPNSDAVAYIDGSNFISSKMVTNSPSPSLNYTNQGAYADQQMLLPNVHHRPSYSPKPSGGYENRALTVEPGKNYNSLLDSNERAQLGLMTRKLEDHLIKKQFDAQLSKVSDQSHGSQNEEMLMRAAQNARQSTRSNNIILAQIQTSREIAKSCRDMTSSSNETFY